MIAFRIPSFQLGVGRRLRGLLVVGMACLASALPPTALGQTADTRPLVTGAMNLDQIVAFALAHNPEIAAKC